MTKRNGISIAWVLVVVLAVSVVLLLWRPWDGGEEPPFDPKKIPEMQETARELDRQKKWCDAQTAWQKLLQVVPDGSKYSASRLEAVKHLEIAKSKCQPSKPPVDILSPSPPKELPTPLKDDQIARFYKVGKKVHSVAYLNVTGEGTNQNWILRGTAHFAYQYRVVVETTVVENRGTVVVFEQHFQDVSQLRAESKKELELNLPDSPILAIVWKEIEEDLLKPFPPYGLIKRASELMNITDPRLKHTLTRFYKSLKHRGGPLVPDVTDDVPIMEKLNQLAGQRVRIEYHSGLGVTEIKVLDGKTLPPDDLERLAYGGSLLMDYFLSEGMAKANNGPFTVSMADLGGLFGLFNIKASGELKFKKTTTANREKEPVDILEVVGGEVTVDDANGNRTGRIKPLNGFVYYSADKFLVREAKITWKGDAKWSNQSDSLLFGTENLRNVKIESYYEADVVAGAKG